MRWYSLLSCFAGVLIESLAQQSCRYPDLPNHSVPITTELAHFREGYEFSYKCEDNFQFEKPYRNYRTKIWCADGQWRPPQFLRCVDDCDNRCVHGECVVTLDDKSGSPISKCDCHKNYAGEDCSARVCEVLPLKPHHEPPTGPRIHASRYVAVESSVEFRCTQGYGIRSGLYWVDRLVSTCTTSSWDPPVPDCLLISCAPPAAQFLSISSRYTRTVYRVGDVITVSCSQGCITSSESLTCSDRGTWSPQVPRFG